MAQVAQSSGYSNTFGREEYSKTLIGVQRLFRIGQVPLYIQYSHILTPHSTSVCEKLLSHWLALCMYNYLKGRPGEELYSLYSAIKVQINKGPIDAITGEAKYSLNQDNMLRMTFEVNVSQCLLVIRMELPICRQPLKLS